MLLYLNLTNKDVEQFAEYETKEYRYFEDFGSDEEEKKEGEGEDQASDEKAVEYLFVIGFDHKIGSVIE